MSNVICWKLKKVIDSKRWFDWSCPLLQTVWTIPPVPNERLINPTHFKVSPILPTPIESLTNPTHSHWNFDQDTCSFWKFDQSCMILHFHSFSNPTTFHREFDRSCLLPQKVWPVPPTTAESLTNPTNCCRKLDQSHSLPQKV